jgi:hypothetical protein
MEQRLCQGLPTPATTENKLLINKDFLFYRAGKRAPPQSPPRRRGRWQIMRFDHLLKISPGSTASDQQIVNPDASRAMHQNLNCRVF